MSITTLNPIAIGDSPADRDAYQAGIDEAHDDHATGATLDILRTRLDWMSDHLPTASDAYAAYALGYGAAVTALRINATTSTGTRQEAVTA